MVETARRRQIEDVASGLFRSRGYTATSVRDIARALDLQGGSLYAHVASKEDVLWAIVGRAADEFERAADATDALRPDPRTHLEAIVRSHVRVVTAAVEHASVFAYEWRFLSPHRRAEMAARRDAYEARIRGIIEAGVASGTFRPVDPGLTANFLLTGLNGIATWYRPDGRLTPEQIADEYADLAARALTEDKS